MFSIEVAIVGAVDVQFTDLTAAVLNVVDEVNLTAEQADGDI